MPTRSNNGTTSPAPRHLASGRGFASRLSGMEQNAGHFIPLSSRASAICMARGGLSWPVTLIVAAVVAVALEVGTLWGAPATSPVDLASWSVARLAVFFLVCVPFVRLIASQHLPGRIASWWLANDHEGPRHAGISLLWICIGVAVVVVAKMELLPGSDSTFGWRWACLLCALWTAGVLAIRNHELMAQQVEYGFLVTALAAGVVCCLFMPAYAASSWDGYTHFDWAQALSYITDAEYTGADTLMATQNEFFWSRQIQNEETLTPQHDEAAARSVESVLRTAESEPVAILEGTTDAAGESWVRPATIGHLPNAVGLWLGRLLHLDAEGRYLLGRLGGAVFWSVVMFFAMRQLTSGKMIVGAIGLLPTLVLLSASYTYDVWSVGLIAYAFARFAGALQRRRPLEAKDAWGIAIPFVLGALVRAVLFPLLLCFLVVPARRFRSVREARGYRLVMLVAALALLASFVLPFLVSPQSSGDDRGTTAIGPAAQLAFILEDPLRYAGIWLDFVASYLAPVRLVVGEPLCFSAPYLADPTLPLCVVCNIGCLANLVLVSLFDRSRDDGAYAHISTKVASIVGLILSLGLVCTAMYVSFTAVGATTIDGVQVRYLLSFLTPLNLLVLAFGPLCRWGSRQGNKGVSCGTPRYLCVERCSVLLCGVLLALAVAVALLL